MPSYRFVLALMAVMLSVGLAAGAEKLKSISTIEVYDATGKKVGEVFSLFNNAAGVGAGVLMAFEVEDQPVVLPVSTRGFTSGGSPFFNSGNCSGTPLLPFNETLLLPQAVLSAPGKTLYLQMPDAVPQRFIPFTGTRLNPDGTCTPVNFDNIELVTARPVVDLDMLFTPPFSVR
jgi:hypothetical protein